VFTTLNLSSFIISLIPIIALHKIYVSQNFQDYGYLSPAVSRRWFMRPFSFHRRPPSAHTSESRRSARSDAAISQL